MPAREVILYPDPALREVSKEVAYFDKTLAREIDDLVDTLRASHGVAIAAPQVGIIKRVIALDITARNTKETGHGLLVLVNPVISESSQNKTVREGCLSIPDYLANVKRAKKVTVDALNQSGKAVTVHARGLEAVALQHEIDHLDGILFFDRVTSVRDLLRRG
ncbi:Peptide deformylase [hydrothermal vent metagenome]|uniref:Peptide deformylase n=1 Tax=hydrothermal vent metagenome TaxID=652676 RepID=A0A3B0VM64_9ZZZZ